MSTKLKIRFETILLVFLFALALVNLVGALGPELGFDALWYHLTIPKLYIQEGKMFYIPGNLLYYSAMPKLVEILYIPAIYVGGEIFAKLIHFAFGIGSLVVLYKLSRILLSKTQSLLVLVVFYSNLVVAWQSITAYIDLGRTFFEILALYFLVLYIKHNKESSIKCSAASLGLAISSKLLAIGSLIVFVVILLLKNERLLILVKFIFLVSLMSSPWLIFSFLNTGNLFYPFFENIYKITPSLNILNITNLIYSSDPISPIYLIVLPLILFVWKKFDKLTKVVVIYSIISFLIWYFTPQTGGGRYIMPYLPAYSILVVVVIFKLSQPFIKNFIVLLILFIGLVTLFYRGVANAKYLPVIFGIESKHDFLSKNLNFGFGDFYDVDYYFKNKIKPQDKVLIYGTHNLYYVNFPFIHESWLKQTDKFNYVMTQNVELPNKFSDWQLIYENRKTYVKLYSRK